MLNEVAASIVVVDLPVQSVITWLARMMRRTKVCPPFGQLSHTSSLLKSNGLVLCRRYG